jgi:hypothetical protein
MESRLEDEKTEKSGFFVKACAAGTTGTHTQHTLRDEMTSRKGIRDAKVAFCSTAGRCGLRMGGGRGKAGKEKTAKKREISHIRKSTHSQERMRKIKCRLASFEMTGGWYRAPTRGNRKGARLPAGIRGKRQAWATKACGRPRKADATKARDKLIRLRFGGGSVAEVVD